MKRPAWMHFITNPLRFWDSGMPGENEAGEDGFERQVKYDPPEQLPRPAEELLTEYRNAGSYHRLNMWLRYRDLRSAMDEVADIWDSNQIK